MREPNSRALLSPDDPAGSCPRIVLSVFLVAHRHTERVALYAEREAFAITAFLFLLPRARRRSGAHRLLFCVFLYFVVGIFRIRNANLFAANQILDFISGMIAAISGDSKLCALLTRHATENFLAEISAAQLGKGRGFAPPRCIPSVMPQAARAFTDAKPLRLRRPEPETVPVSAPFGYAALSGFAHGRDVHDGE